PAGGATWDGYYRRRSHARGVRDAGHAGRGGEIAWLVEPVQHGASNLRGAQASGFAALRRGAAQPQGFDPSRAGTWPRGGRAGSRLNVRRQEADMNKTVIKIEQVGSAIRRHHSQRETLIGLGLNRIGRVVELPDTPQTRGMIAKVRHLVRIVEAQGESR